MKQSELLADGEHLSVDQTRAAPAPARVNRRVRNWWTRQFHTWHWISAAVSLAAMLLFAVTGLTLNHAASISAKPVVVEQTATLSPLLLAMLKPTPAPDTPLPPLVSVQLESVLGIDTAGRRAEWSAGEVYVAMPAPGRDAWVSIDRATGAVASEVTDRGWVSYVNDLHKGRNTGSAWFWFIDLFAGACILFTLTGLLLLHLHSRHRAMTWPLVGLSLAVPVVIAAFFIH